MLSATSRSFKIVIMRAIFFFKMFDRLRKLVGVYFTDETGMPLSFLGQLLGCIWCTSVWVAAFVTVVMFTDWWVVLVPFALSTGAILIEEVIDDG